uniref:Guanylate cyclase activator 2B n=1 Tax=Amphiprion percula TaxID=161767 RepID=A0A3P8TWW2_AMPPE
KMLLMDLDFLLVANFLVTECPSSFLSLQVRDRHFPLQAVKELKELMDLDEKNPQLTKKVVEEVCAKPLLPPVFRAVCDNEVERKAVFYELGKVDLEKSKRTWTVGHQINLVTLKYCITLLCSRLHLMLSLVYT